MMKHLKPFFFERFRHALDEVDVAVNQQHAQRRLARSHDNTSVARILSS